MGRESLYKAFAPGAKPRFAGSEKSGRFIASTPYSNFVFWALNEAVSPGTTPHRYKNQSEFTISTAPSTVSKKTPFEGGTPLVLLM